MKIRYDERLVADLLYLFENFQSLDNKIKEAKIWVVSQSTGVTIKICSKCNRLTIPRRLWRLIPEDSRPINMVAAGAKDLCATHYTQAVRDEEHIPARRQPLTPEKLEILRRQVGI